MKHTYTEAFFHEQVWTRFVRMPYGHVLDYAGKNGEAYYPTAEECANTLPNPRSWGLPIENGAFFTGLYAYALIEKYNKTKCLKTAEEIQILIRGLELLQDVSKVDGFIARGVADDGISHYPMSAECQFFPWTLALYAYYKTDLCQDKDAIKRRILRAVFPVKHYGWRIPCDVEGLCYPKSWMDETGWRENAMLLCCARILYELTDEDMDRDHFEELVEGTPTGSIFSRKEIITQGYSSDMLGDFGNQTWICTYAHLGLRELMKLDEKNRDIYAQGLYYNGVTAMKTSEKILKYDNKTGEFDLNWRPLNDMWEDWNNNPDRGTAISLVQLRHWNKELVPHRRMEHGILGNALFAAWVAITCGDARIAKVTAEEFKENLATVDWDTLHLSYAFVAEAALIFAE